MRSNAADLVIDSVVKSYPGRSGRAPALSDVSVSVPAGTTLGVLGPSGCGKSTLLRLISGIESPDAGAPSCPGRDSPSTRIVAE